MNLSILVRLFLSVRIRIGVRTNPRSEAPIGVDGEESIRNAYLVTDGGQLVCKRGET